MEEILYNSSFPKIHSIMSNETEVDLQDYFNESEWCQENQTPPSSPALDGMGSVADFSTDVSKPGQKFFPVDKKYMKFYSKPGHEPPPEVIAAIAAFHQQPQETGLDYRPHLFDSVSNSHILIDSGSVVSACSL